MSSRDRDGRTRAASAFSLLRPDLSEPHRLNECRQLQELSLSVRTDEDPESQAELLPVVGSLAQMHALTQLTFRTRSKCVCACRNVLATGRGCGRGLRRSETVLCVNCSQNCKTAP